jgi:pyruvate/2-oxoglutarate/acetoin dehydrogenase E1 component
MNMEINNRVMKKMDKDSLYGVIQKLQEKIFIKKNINTIVHGGIISEIIKSYKKEAYSSIAKRMKRFGKNKTLVPSNFCNNGQYQFCKLESLNE